MLKFGRGFWFCLGVVVGMLQCFVSIYILEEYSSDGLELGIGLDSIFNPPEVIFFEVVPGVIVHPVWGLFTSEDTNVSPVALTVTLKSQPDVDVIFPGISPVEIDNTATEGYVVTDEATLTPATLTFTFLDWEVPQTVLITGVDDNFADGDQEYTIKIDPLVSGDAGYSGLAPNDIVVRNIDDDVAGIKVRAATHPLITSETGGTNNFSVVLTTEPIADVIIGNTTSGDTSEGTVSPGTLTFTSVDWFAPQTVTITAVNDDDQDGDITYTVNVSKVSSADPDYFGIDPADIVVVNRDNDTPGITVSPVPLSLSVNETATTATFTVVLNSELFATSVTIGPITSGNTDEVTVAPSFLTFTSTDWNISQAVVVTGVDDSVTDGTQTVTVDLGASSGPADYTLGDLSNTATTPPGPGDVAVRNTDDDTAGITVTPTTGLVTSEAGATDVFTVALTSQPIPNLLTGDVLINVDSSDGGEGSTNPITTLTFTTTTWGTAQTITVQDIVNDAQLDGDIAYTIVLSMHGSTDDVTYGAMDPDDVTATNQDDEVLDIVLSTTSATVNEHATVGTTTSTFTAVLTVESTSNVTVPFSISPGSAYEAALNPASLTFTTLDWMTPQSVTITGIDDHWYDTDQTVYVNVDAASGSVYAGYDDVDNIEVTVVDAEPTLAQFILASMGVAPGTSAFADYSNSSHIVSTSVGTPTHENSGSPITGSDASSFYLDGATDAIKSGDHTDWQFGTGDFTVDFWLNIEAFTFGGPRAISYESTVAMNNGWQIIIQNNGDLNLQLPPAAPRTFSGLLPGSPTPTLTTGWHHYAIVRSGCPGSCVVTVYFDGGTFGTMTTGEGAGQDVTGDSSYQLYIGYRPGNVGFMNGWIDNIRIYKGLARWTAPFAFTPSTYFPYTGDEPGPP